jgi:hypothetical protein
VHICIKKFIDNLPLAPPTSKQDINRLKIALGLSTSEEEDIERLKKGTFYSFANNPSKLKTLDLYGCDDLYANDWKEHPERLEGLLAAMANTQIKHSLEKIYVYHCGVSQEQVWKMMDRHGFTNIKGIYANYK